MSVKPRRNFSGAFQAKRLGDGAWQLSRRAPHEAEVFLLGVEPDAAHAFGTAPIVDLGIVWNADNVLLSFQSCERASTVSAAGAIVHEPLERLYESLPLASIDADARRFWRRVFRLVRIPGGRYLLKVLTRSRRR